MTTIYVREGTPLPERADFDLYETEPSLIMAATKQCVSHHYYRHILDIGAGDGRWGAIFADAARARVRPLTGVDIRPLPKPVGYTDWYGSQDFLTWSTSFKYDLIVSNPPYSLAEPIIRHAWDMLETSGTMLMLLRTSFLESVGRFDGLWAELWPSTVYVLARRPSFYGGGKTNGTSFSIFRWDKDEHNKPVGEPREAQLRIINYERKVTT
jgi:hypothetical protein